MDISIAFLLCCAVPLVVLVALALMGTKPK